MTKFRFPTYLYKAGVSEDTVRVPRHHIDEPLASLKQALTAICRAKARRERAPCYARARNRAGKPMSATSLTAPSSPRRARCSSWRAVWTCGSTGP